MKLEGSCHCQAVRFTLESAQPYPFMRCYCSICRKTAGGGGFAINLGGDYRTLQIDGREHLGIYRARHDADGGTRVSEGAGISAAFVVAHCGCGTRAGRTWCIRSPRPSTATCQCRRSIRI